MTLEPLVDQAVVLPEFEELVAELDRLLADDGPSELERTLDALLRGREAPPRARAA